MKKHVYIRTDASALIGLGHLVRCTSLAWMLTDHFFITFFCKEISSDLVQRLTADGFTVKEILAEDAFFNELYPDLIIILDGYHFDRSYQEKIRKAGCKLICIDDIHEQAFSADLIINHAPGIVAADYKNSACTEFALGPDYALIRPSFLRQAKKKRSITNIETLFICFGGADNKNFTKKTLQAALSMNTFQKINVVTGAAYAHRESLRILLEDKRVVHHHAAEEKDMLLLMTESELAIVPASGTLFEVLAAGCIAISGWYIENQQKIYEGFLQTNAIYGAERFQDMEGAIRSVLGYNKIKNNFLIDGLSGERIITKINAIMN